MNITNIDTTPQEAGRSLLELKYGRLPDQPYRPSRYPHGLARVIDAPQQELTLSRAIYYGDKRDGVIEAAPRAGVSGQVEIGYYFGTEKPKNIIKVSAQIGCGAACTFCELGSTPLRRNTSLPELQEQVSLMAQVVALTEPDELLKPHKVSIAGSGEPLLNGAIPQFMEWLGELRLSIKLSTVFPRGSKAHALLEAAAKAAAGSPASAQLQISLISTDERFRAQTAGPIAATFSEVRHGADRWLELSGNRRKVNMSLILAEETPADARSVMQIFPPESFRFRFRNYIPTPHGAKRGLTEISPARLLRIKDEFRAAGFEVTDHATPTSTERRFGLASNVTLAREGGTKQ